MAYTQAQQWGISCVTSNVSVVPCSVSAELPNKVETRKLVQQVCLADAKGRYQQVSTFERDRMVGLREAGVSNRDIAARTGHAAKTVVRVWNQWREEGRTQRRAGTGPRNVTTARDDRHLVLMAVTTV